MPQNSRMQRERKTVRAMISLYCMDHHQTHGLCPDCEKLAAYADRRLDACPFGDGKTTCSKCRVHCYKPEMREKIREIMRYAGPRMIRRHPLLALRHITDGIRKTPVPGINKSLPKTDAPKDPSIDATPKTPRE